MNSHIWLHAVDDSTINVVLCIIIIIIIIVVVVVVISISVILFHSVYCRTF